jgi:hypothetical protein
MPKTALPTERIWTTPTSAPGQLRRPLRPRHRHYRDNIIVYAPDGLLASRPGDSTVGPAVLVAAWCCCPPASPNPDPEPQLPGD